MKRQPEPPDRTVLMQVLRDQRPRRMKPLYEALTGKQVPLCRMLILRHDWHDINVEGIARSGHVSLRAVACPACGWAIEIDDAGSARCWRLSKGAVKTWRKALRAT